MEAQIEQIPQSGQLDITIHVSASVNYSAESARRLVGRFVANEISYLLRAGEPTLVVADRIRWRVPVMFALPQVGMLGSVGHIDVAVETGEYFITPETIEEMKQNATEKATHYSATAGSTPETD